MLYERYSGEHKVKYHIDDMIFDVWSNKLCGRLNLYSLKQKEPERPMFFELRRNGENNNTTENVDDNVSVAPNPFETTFCAKFELQEDADVQVRVFNTYGIMEWQKDLGHMEKGKNEIMLSPNIKRGKYIMNIKAGIQNFHVIIIKG